VRAPPAIRPLYLSDGAEQIFTLLHPAAGDARRDTAVLICPPFGWEDVCSYRSRREWAVQLAAAGFPTLRIDLPGTGDSSGSSADARRLSAWADAVGVAARWLAADSGCGSVAAIGIGLGGLLICAAIAEQAPIDQAVLWAVPARGGALVRELRAFERMESAKFAGRRNGEPPPPSGPIRVGGFVLSAETVQALEGLDLSALAFPDGHPRRVLLLERDGIGVDQRLRERFERGGAIVRIAPGAGYGAMMAEPQEARPPARVFSLVREWLERDDRRAARPPGDARDSERPGREPTGEQGTVRAIRARDAAELESAGVRVS
jgi:pimeloyl-ACP methyl ester carboxylesterase